jgi:streptogramin lyase
VILMDGEDGSIDQMVNLGNSVTPSYYGIYGGAVDGDGNFWGSQLGQGKLVNVQRDDMTFEVWPMATSGYGMTVDHNGFVWTCSSQVGKFDPQSETWQTATVNGSGGCMGDGDNTLWVSANVNGLVGVDMETLTVSKTVNLNGTYIHGTSVDFYGYVWGVAYSATYAYRVDPDSLQFDTFQGLTGPYTYSDMTGFALSSAGSPNG